MQKQVHVIISGKVQGVWYRASTKQKADMLGLTGWVKNTNDGNVEALFEGDERAISEMISWCKKGPPLAQVTDVKVQHQKISGTFTGFEVLYR